MSLAALGITWASRVTIQRSGGSDQPWPTLVRTPTGLTDLSMAGAATARAIGPKMPADAVPSVRPALARNSRRRIGSVGFRPSVKKDAARVAFSSVMAQHVPGRLAFRQGRDAQQLGDRHPGLIISAQLLGVVGDADGVVGEGLALEIGLALRRAGEIVDLQLDPVVVRVAVVHRRRDPMIDWPLRQDASRLQPAVGRQQLAEIAVGISDMVGTGTVGVARL